MVENIKISSTQIVQHLDDILNSRYFREAPRLQKMLEYCVLQVLEGQEAQLSASGIALLYLRKRISAISEVRLFETLRIG